MVLRSYDPDQKVILYLAIADYCISIVFITEIIQWRGRKRCYNICVLIKTVSNFFNFRKVASLKRIGIKPVSIAEQVHIMKCLLGVSIVSSNFILRVLRNADASKNADDRNDNQQLYECET